MKTYYPIIILKQNIIWVETIILLENDMHSLCFIFTFITDVFTHPDTLTVYCLTLSDQRNGIRNNKKKQVKTVNEMCILLWGNSYSYRDQNLTKYLRLEFKRTYVPFPHLFSDA